MTSLSCCKHDHAQLALSISRHAALPPCSSCSPHHSCTADRSICAHWLPRNLTSAAMKRRSHVWRWLCRWRHCFSMMTSMQYITRFHTSLISETGGGRGGGCAAGDAAHPGAAPGQEPLPRPRLLLPRPRQRLAVRPPTCLNSTPTWLWTIVQHAFLFCCVPPRNTAHLITPLLLRRIVLWEALLTFAFVSPSATLSWTVACCQIKGMWTTSMFIS